VKLSDTSIKRPIFTAMMMVAVVVFGLVMFRRLNVDLFPKVDFPIVTITTIYPGADPETMETKVADPIEEAVNSLSGIDQLRSTSLEGVAQVFVQFEIGVDLGQAAQDVRDRVASIQRDLPQGAEPPVVEKLDLGASPIMQIAVHGPAPAEELARYAEDVLRSGLERVNGVGQLELIGGREREAHVFVDPDKLRTYGLTITDVVRALSLENIDIPGGRVTRGGEELVVRTNAQAASAEELADVVLSSHSGAVLRVRDVATVDDSLEEQRSMAQVDGKSAIAVVIRKQSDANTIVVADAVKKALPKLEALAPKGTKVEVLVDNSRQIRSSVETVELDLVLGAVLAVAIIFLFLRDWRATFISALALPTSVIGTFAFVKFMGFTLNMMTTLALSLSIGILIDDAIVVIENIVRHRTELKESAYDAAQRGTAEIGLAVLATTMSIVAVFVPVAFMEGMVGQFFFEFGLTVAFAVLLSLFVSFTLTPMLSARMLTAHHAGESGGISGAIERALRGTEQAYRVIIRWALGHRFITLVIAVGALIGSFVVAGKLGFEFVPPEDRGQFQINFELPTGTSLDETAKAVFALAEETRRVQGVTSTFTTVGGGVQEKVNTAAAIVTILPKNKRTFSQADMMAYLRRKLAGRPGVLLSIEQLQNVSGGGFRAAPVQYNLRGDDLAELERVSNEMVAELKKTPGFADVDMTYRAGKPELNVELDRKRAADLGVQAFQVAQVVRTLVAGEVATELETEGDRHDVRVQLPPELRTSVEVLRRAQVRTSTGQLVEIGTLGEVRESTGPSQIERQSRQRQVTVMASLEGKALSEAMKDVDRIAAKVVPPTITTAVAGFGERLEESNKSMAFSMLLAVLCIYMILASQFESLLHPFTIMVSLPFSLIGAFGGMLIAQMHMSIFAMIGLIMLMGLVTKNAILLVDFAVQLKERGTPMREALENAGATRLRPILMTTAAMVFGMMPVAIGHGDGGETRAPMGITVIGGLITSTFLTLVVVPVVYTFMEAVGRVFSRATSRFSASEAEQPAHKPGKSLEPSAGE
jgi:HAE1 family hydrophobic/amphiphilic exporter-1